VIATWLGQEESYDVISFNFEQENIGFVSSYKIDSTEDSGYFAVSIV